MAKKYGRRLRLSKEEEELIYQHRAAPLKNINGNTALDLHIEMCLEQSMVGLYLFT